MPKPTTTPTRKSAKSVPNKKKYDSKGRELIRDEESYGNEYDPHPEKKKPEVYVTPQPETITSAQPFSGFSKEARKFTEDTEAKNRARETMKAEQPANEAMAAHPFTGWSADVRKYTDPFKALIPEKKEEPEKKKDTLSRDWAKTLSPDEQRKEQREDRREPYSPANVLASAASTTAPVTRSKPVLEKNPRTQAEEETPAPAAAREKPYLEKNARTQPSEKPAEVPAPPAVTPSSSKPTSAYASFMGDDDEDADGVEEEYVAPEDTNAPEMPKTREQQRSDLEKNRDDLQKQYSELYTLINSGLDGHDFDASAYDRLESIGEQIKSIGDQIKALEGNADWEGRDALVEEYTRLYNKKNGYGSFMYSGLTPEEEARMQEVERLLQAGDAEAGNDSQYYAFGERVMGATEGGLKKTYSDLVNTAVTIGDFLGQAGSVPLAGSQYVFNPDIDYEAAAAKAAAVHNFFGPGYEYVNRISDSAAEQIEKAKGGLGKLGQDAVDAYNSLLGMGVDAALSPLTGGSTLAAMFLRTFGAGAKEARDAGADIFAQVGYGIADGAIEVMTEKLGGLKIYGQNISDDAVKTIVNSLAETPAGRALLNTVFAAHSEGMEEVISDLLHPFAERIYNDEAIKTLLENGYSISDLFNSYLVGAALGMAGGAVENVGTDSSWDAIGIDARSESNYAPENVAEQPVNSIVSPPVAPPAPAISQAPGMEIGRETDTGSGGGPSVADILASSASSEPAPVEERKTSGEDRAEEKEPEGKKEEAAPTEEKKEPEPFTGEQKTREKEAPAEEDKKLDLDTPEGKRSKAAELRKQAQSLIDQVDIMENNHEGQEYDSAQELYDEADSLIAEAERLEREADGKTSKSAEEEEDLWANSEPVSPAATLAEAASEKTSKSAENAGPAEALSEAVGSKESKGHESVPESTQKGTEGGSEKLNSGPESESAEASKKQARMEAADADTKAEAERLSTEFEQDPVNVQRFQDGQGTYSQYSPQERLAVLQHMFPEEDYYLSGGNIVKGRTYTTTTGQSDTFGDKRTGSNFAKPKATSPKSNIPGPTAKASSFDPQTVKVGDTLTHNTWGNVKVVWVENGNVRVELPDGEVKTVLQDRMGEYFSSSQSGEVGGTISSSSQNGGKQNEESARADSGEEYRPIQPEAKGKPDSGMDENGPKPVSRTAEAKAKQNWGENAKVRRAETAEEHGYESLAKKISGSDTEVLFVTPGENQNNVVKSKTNKPIAGLCTIDENGHATILISTAYSANPVFETATVVHESIHAKFASMWGDGKDSGALGLFLRFAKKGSWSGNELVDIVLNIGNAYYENCKKQFSLPDLDPASPTYREDLSDAINNSVGFSGRIANEFFAFVSSGTLGDGSPIGVDMDALQKRAHKFLHDNNIIDQSAFAGCPTASQFAEAEKQNDYESINGYPPSKDPGENKSYGESLKANEPAPQPETGERADDDMTPLNEMDRERDEERREKQKAETKKKFGSEPHKRLSDAFKKLESWAKKFTERYGEVEKDMHGGIVEDENGNPVKNSTPSDFVKRVRSMLEGEETIQSFREYYESLKPSDGDPTGTDGNYLYDGALAAELDALADAERELIYAEKGGPANAEKATQFGEGPSLDIARENFTKAMDNFSRSFETRMDLLQQKFEDRVEFNGEVTGNAKGENSGYKNWFQRRVQKFWNSQMRIDTFLKNLVGYSSKATVANDLAQRNADAQNTRNTVRNNARQFFYDMTSDPKAAKAWADIESGKTKGSVSIPGLNENVSLNYELAILKTLMTNGAMDHIARFGAQFVNEGDYIKGYNNNGRGETESYQQQVRLTREALDQMATDNLKARDEKLTGKNIYNEKVAILKNLRNELMSDIKSNEVALAAYNASTEAMKYLADELNDVTLRLYGLAKALQGSNYWPMQVIGRGNNLQFLNNTAFTLEDASYLQHRRGGSGALFIAPFTETMDNYINRASKFVGYGELNSDLLMMSKEMGVGHGEHDAEKQSIQSTIKKQAGKAAADWMSRYMETLNGQAKSPSGIGSKLRSNLAGSSLLANPGVALKQTASYMNAAGVLDFDVLVKNRLASFGALRSAKSYENNTLIKAINEKTGVLASRKTENTVQYGEANSDRSMSGKLTKWIPKWAKNWIQKQDYRTVANLALACGEQVKKNNPGIDTNSDAYYQKVAELLENVVVKTQPIYDAEFRPDYLRSDNEIVRMMAMFRTQQSQNLNQLMQAYGELAAAKREGGDVKAASKKVNQTVAGFVAAQTMFSVLSTAAKMLLHKKKDYEDEDGNIDLGKVAKRVGLDFFSSAAGVVWFGDTAAKLLVDAATGVYAKATGNKDAATSEFYKLSDNTISNVDSLIASAIKVFQNPTPKNIRTAVFDAAQATGIPARNLYNLFNSAFMYVEDARGKNPGNYDDAIDMLQTEHNMSDDARATRTTNTACSYFKKGNAEKADALLSTLDYSDASIRSRVKTAAGNAYVAGEIDEATYKHILRDYTNEKSADVNKTVHEKDLDKTIADITATDPKKYNALTETIKDAKDHAAEGESKSALAAELILDAAMDKKGADAFMEKYTGSGYFKAYDALRGAVSPNKAVDILTSIDKDHDDKFEQEELYEYFKGHPGDNPLALLIWNSNKTWTTSWSDYKAQKAKTSEYDAVKGAHEDDLQFGAAEKALKDLKSGATMHIQTQGNDPEMYKVISGMGLSDKDTDIVVDKYISTKSKTNYHALRDAGFDPKSSFELMTKLDSDGNGTIKKTDLYKYYKKHPESKDMIRALFEVQGYKKNKRPLTWKEFKSGK